MIDSQVVAVLASVIRPIADGPEHSALLSPVDLQRTLRALATLARAELSHDDIAGFCMPSLSVLLNSLLASVSRDGEGGADPALGPGAGVGAGWREGEGEGGAAGGGGGGGVGGGKEGVDHEDDSFAVVSTLSQDNVEAAAETLLLVLQVCCE
jgi:hypothetical protein